jgi:LysR family nitrogen assimilation transcriptional regulator
MRLRQLECFVRTCELGSINRAAEQLNVAQPALGLQIRNLEQDFGATLLVRTSRGVKPTEAGELMLDWARDMLERTRLVKVRLKELSRTDVDSLRLGLSPSATMLLAGAILERASTELAELSLRVVEGLSHIVVRGVESGEVDLALITGPFEARGLAQRPMLQEQLYLISRPGSEAGPIALSDVLALPLAMPGENDALRGLVEAAARRLDLPLTVTYEIGSIPAIKDLVARGMAHGILPWGNVSREVRNGELAARPVVAPDLTRTLFLIRLEGRTVGPRERRLVSLIEQCLTDLVATEMTGASVRLL